MKQVRSVATACANPVAMSSVFTLHYVNSDGHSKTALAMNTPVHFPGCPESLTVDLYPERTHEPAQLETEVVLRW